MLCSGIELESSQTGNIKITMYPIGLKGPYILTALLEYLKTWVRVPVFQTSRCVKTLWEKATGLWLEM